MPTRLREMANPHNQVQKTAGGVDYILWSHIIVNTILYFMTVTVTFPRDNWPASDQSLTLYWKYDKYDPAMYSYLS